MHLTKLLFFVIFVKHTIKVIYLTLIVNSSQKKAISSTWLERSSHKAEVTSSSLVLPNGYPLQYIILKIERVLSQMVSA